MKKYVFNEYRDKMGIGSKKIFDSELEAVQAAKDHWENMTESDQRSYLDDPAGMFLVFEIEATQEQLEKIESGDVLVDGFWMADIWDALN